MEFPHKHQQKATWNETKGIPDDVVYYEYRSKYPHYQYKMGNILNIIKVIKNFMN